MTRAVCQHRNALCHPYYTCSTCRLDFDDETFYHHGAGGSGKDPFRSRSRAQYTICKACRQQERQLLKGESEHFDHHQVSPGRWRDKARSSVLEHARRFKKSRHEFEKNGWNLDTIVEEGYRRTERNGRLCCEYCTRPFRNLDDITIDVVVPSKGLSWALNVKIVCNTCNVGKRPFEHADNAEELIQRWLANWRRWVEHQENCLGRSLGELPCGHPGPIGTFNAAGLGFLFAPNNPPKPITQEAVFKNAGIADLVVPPKPTPSLPSPPPPRSKPLPNVLEQEVIWHCHRCRFLHLGPPLEECPKCGWQDSSC